MRGRLEKDDESIRLLAKEIQSIEAVLGASGKEITVHLSAPPHDQATLESLADLFNRHQGTRKVTLVLELRTQVPPIKVRAELSKLGIQPSEEFIEEVERICGKGTVSWF